MKNKKTNRAYSISNIQTKKFTPLNFQDDFFESLGNPDKAFSAIIWGNSSNGKTSFALQLAKYLTNFGKVAYNSLEEGLSSTIQLAIKRTFMQECENSFVLLDREPFHEMIERMKEYLNKEQIEERIQALKDWIKESSFDEIIQIAIIEHQLYQHLLRKIKKLEVEKIENNVHTQIYHQIGIYL